MFDISLSLAEGGRLFYAQLAWQIWHAKEVAGGSSCLSLKGE